MDKKDIRQMVRAPDLIPGIYNYCDRWCERCSFTSRCANFALGEQYFPNPQDRDITNQRFWDRLHETFQTTLDMLREEAEARGLDLDSVDLTAAERAEEEFETLANSHECVVSAKKYSRLTEQWFDSSEGLFEEKRRELELVTRLDLPDRNPHEEVANLQDAVEVIRWYQYQIQIKLVRAVRRKTNDLPEISEDFPKDSDGSAKVALLGMDRSIAAWGVMSGHFPEREDDILDILIHLDRLRRKTEEEFPAARAFVRPGFDEGD